MNVFYKKVVASVCMMTCGISMYSAELNTVLFSNNPQDVFQELNFSLDLSKTNGSEHVNTSLKKVFLAHYILRERTAQLTYADGKSIKTVQQLEDEEREAQKNKKFSLQGVAKAITSFVSKPQEGQGSYEQEFGRLAWRFKDYVTELRALESYNSNALQYALDVIPADKQKPVLVKYFGSLMNYVPFGA